MNVNGAHVIIYSRDAEADRALLRARDESGMGEFNSKLPVRP